MPIVTSNSFDINVSTLPAWRTAMTPNTVTSFSTVTLDDVDPCPAGNCVYTANDGHQAVCNNWTGGMADSRRLWLPWNGGHNGYAGNEIYMFDAMEETPIWRRVIDPSTSVQQYVTYYADGRASSRHSYGHYCYIPTLSGSSNGNRLFAAISFNVYGQDGGYGGTDIASAEISNPLAPVEDPQGFFNATSSGGLQYQAVCAWDSGSERVMYMPDQIGGGYGLRAFDPRTNTWTAATTFGAANDFFDTMATIDPVRRIMITVCNFGARIAVHDLENDVGAAVPARLYNVSGLPSVRAPGVEYDSVRGEVVIWGGGRNLTRLNIPANYRTGDGSPPNPLNTGATYTTSTITFSGVTPTNNPEQGGFGKFRYLSDLDGYVAVNQTTEPTWFWARS